MAFRLFVLRFLCLVSLAVWLGGFTFYGAVVVPVLHDSLGSLDAGIVTQRVTDYLNAIGVATIALWSLAAWVERSEGSVGSRRMRIGLLGVTSSLLLALILLHRVMDGQLDTGSLRGFYPLHRAYLIASTAQWFVNVGLLAVSLLLWSRTEHAADVAN
jgi:hypothetical protein